jgi:C-terminal processing protease CtpA/Prc
MLGELKDDHTKLMATIDNQEFESKITKPYSFKGSFYSFNDLDNDAKTLISSIKSTLITKDFSLLKEFRVDQDYYSYSLSENFAYVSIALYKSHLKFFKREFLDIISTKKGLILDLRYNKGGFDGIAREIAGCFCDTKYIGNQVQYWKYRKKKFGKLKKKKVRPRAHAFLKPVIILTSDMTSSSTEVLVLCMRKLPHVVIMGQQSRGIIASVDFIRLPNSWELMMTNSRIYSSEMESYETIGIPPDILIENNSLEQSNDNILNSAIEYLEENT